MTDQIDCEHHNIFNGQPVCQAVADISNRPLVDCHTNDRACEICLKLVVPPRTPNSVVASMVISASKRSGDKSLQRNLYMQMRPHVEQATVATVTDCVLRGEEVRQVPCKPCQIDSLTQVTVPAYSCPKYGECTIHNTEIFPRIKACSTCEDRQEPD